MSRFANMLCYSSSSTLALQVAALKEHYRNLSANEKKLEQADFIGLTVIPTIAGCFIASYWIIGMMKYHSPDWSAYQDLLPQFGVGTTIWKHIENLNIRY